MPIKYIFALSLSTLLSSQACYAGFFDTLKEAKEAVNSAKEALENLPTSDEKTAPPADNQNEQPEKQSTQASAPKNQTSLKAVPSTKNKNGINADFVNSPERVAKLPYEACPKVDVMGIRLGQNINTLADKYPLKFSWRGNTGFVPRVDGIGAMRFDDHERGPGDKLTYPGGVHQTSVYSKDFRKLHHQSINHQYDYTFSNEDYNQITEAIHSAGRHNTLVNFYIKPPKTNRLPERLFNDVAEVITDINGDIAAIYVSRTLPVEINVTDVQSKLTEKYGKSHQVVKGPNDTLKYQLSWTAKKERSHPKYGNKSHITYRLTCHSALIASTEITKTVLSNVASKIKSMRKETGVSVEI